MLFCKCLRLAFIAFLFSILSLDSITFSQEPNPVDRKVSNPITDTPNINPVSNDTRIFRKSKEKIPSEGGDGELVVYSDRVSAEGEPGKRVVIHQGNVDIRLGIYRLQADKVTLYED
ncbi:MAG: hypothetical protein D6735_02735, partial [Acidobacteria bacterium]